jgi:L-ribulose-5-phosphate 4-epimerase
LLLSELREQVCLANKQLPIEKLVTMTSGNASGRDPESGLIVVKPSGISFDNLTPDKLVIMDIDGNVIEGTLKPSVDAKTHLYIMKKMPDVHGVIHTHSNYATSFAAIGQPIPCILTAMADEFGGPIPCGPYCQIGEEQIGEAVVKYIGKSPAILLQNHGVFTVGANVSKALKAAVMTEDVAKTVHLALLKGTPIPIPEEEIKRGHIRYMTQYGQ